MEQEELVEGVSSVEVDELMKTTPPDQLIGKLAELIRWGWKEIRNANLEEKLTEQQIFQLLSMMRCDGGPPVLHELIEWNNPTSTVKLLKQITDEDQIKQLIFMKDKYQRNSLSKAVNCSKRDVVRYIYTRLSKDNLYKLLHVQDYRGNTTLHYASWRDYPLDELLEPFTTTESHELLSIMNNHGLTVDDMVQSLKREASSQEIDRWFGSTPSEVLIVRLARSMYRWRYEDLDRLNLEERLTAGQIVDLLKAKPCFYRYDLPVLHDLIRCNPTFAGKLLKQITDEDHFKQLIFIKDDEGLTVLSFSIKHGLLKCFHSLITFYSDRQSELLELGTIPDNEGNTSFHYAAGMPTSDYLTALVQATLTFKLRKMVADALEKKNASNETVERHRRYKPLPANAIIYQWVQESTKNRQYLLFDYPKILVISNEAEREGAKEEAKALIDCFQSLGLKVDVKPNRKKEEMLDDLKEASKSKTGLIVAIMSHGGLGFIEDNERKEKIDIKDLEKSMTHHDCNTPKCLILQCCQGSGAEQSNETNRNPSEPVKFSNDAYRAEQLTAASSSETTHSSDTTPANTTLGGSPREDANPSNERIEAYVPTSRHFCAIMSSVPGQPSQRNKFIPALVKAIEQLEPNESIFEAFTMAVEELFLDLPDQTPLILGTLMQNFCIKNVLPLVLKRSGVNDEGVGENIKSEVVNEQGEGLGQTQVEAQGGKRAGAHHVAPKGDVGGALDGAVDGEPDGVIGGAVSVAAHGAVGSVQGCERKISTTEVTARRVTPRK